MDNEYFWETRTALEKSSYSSPPPPYPNPPHNLATHLTKHTYIHILASNIFYFQERYKNIFTLKKNFQVKRGFLGERGGGGYRERVDLHSTPKKFLDPRLAIFIYIAAHIQQNTYKVGKEVIEVLLIRKYMYI